MKKSFVIIFSVLLSVNTFSQIETKYTYNPTDSNVLSFLVNKNIPIYNLDYLDFQGAEVTNKPNIFAKGFDVSISLEKGLWTSVDGGRIWSIAIQSTNASSITLFFNEINLPKEGYMYIINDDMTVLYGPVTKENNPNKGHFLSNVIPSNCIRIYIFEPMSAMGETTMNIDRIYCGFKDFSFFNDLDRQNPIRSCDNDVMCDTNFEKESYGISYITYLIGDYLAQSTGFLVMTTDLSFKPYLQTALHTMDYNEDGSLSVQEKASLQFWSFMFNNKKNTCGGSTLASTYTYNGATAKAYSSATDFALLELASSVSNNNTLTWLGWDKSSSVPSSGTAIHHPLKNPMKVSYEYDSFSTSDYEGSDVYNHWLLYFDDGVVKHGSSGSPILNQDKRVVGQLHGNDEYNANQDYCVQPRAQYGKFNLSWTGGGSNDTRLSNWLDPNNTGKTSINSSHPLYISGPNIVCSSPIYFVENLSSNSNYSVIWSFKNASSLNSLIQQNTPSTNQCTITPGNMNFTDTLVATIWYGGTAQRIVEKDIMTPKSLTGTIHQEGQYYYGRNYPSFTIGMESIFAVNQVCQITLQSPKFKYMNFSTTTNPLASVNLQRINDETIQFSVSLSTTDVDLRIYGTGNGSCNDFELRVLAMKNPIDPNNPFYINMSGTTIELELNQAMMRNLNGNENDEECSRQQPWTLDVYEATTGRKVYSGQVEGNSLNIDTSGWGAGIYILYAVINGKTYSTKVTVK